MNAMPADIVRVKEGQQNTSPSHPQIKFCSLYRAEKYSFADSTRTKNKVLPVLRIFISLTEVADLEGLS